MGKRYPALTSDDRAFIAEQKIFFIASASVGEVNLSPKGYETLFVDDPHRLYMIDLPGSGNRTAWDIMANGDLTLLFCSFEKEAKILRLFCKGRLINKYEERFEAPFSHFNFSRKIVRQIFEFQILTVEQSCGMSIPFFDYKGERDELKEWAVEMAQQGNLKRYIEEHEIPPKI